MDKNRYHRFSALRTLGFSYQQIANRVGLSRERIRQIICKGDMRESYYRELRNKYPGFTKVWEG